MSVLVNNTLEMNECEEAEIMLSDCTEPMIKLVIEYCEHFKYAKTETEIKKPLISKDPNVFITDEFERSFMEKLSFDEKCELYTAANLLNVPPLFELLAASIAAWFKGKSYDEVKGDFGLQDVPFTPADEEEIKKENPWIEEQAKRKIEALKKMIEEREAIEKELQI